MRTPFPLMTVAAPPPERVTHGSTRTPSVLPKLLGKLPTPANEELLVLADEEAIERSGPLTEQGLARSRARRVRCARLLYEGAARTSEDYVHAAYVFQFGESEAELDRAHALANRALSFKSVHQHARWLAASTDDQLRMFRGEPQRFGTQYAMQGEKWALYRVDPRVTDAERAQWDVPPLATAAAYVASKNAELEACAE